MAVVLPSLRYAQEVLPFLDGLEWQLSNCGVTQG